MAINWIHLYHLIYHIHFHKKFWLPECIYKQQDYTNKLTNMCILLMWKEVLEHSHDTTHYKYIQPSCHYSSANTDNLTEHTNSFVLTPVTTHNHLKKHLNEKYLKNNAMKLLPSLLFISRNVPHQIMKSGTI